MTCEELQPEYELYALGSSEPPVTDELREHLSRGCENCVPGVRRAMQLSARLAHSVEIVEPPARLRKRVLATVDPGKLEQRIWGWLALTGLATAAIAAFAIISTNSVRNELERARAESRRGQSDLARLNETLSLLDDPDSQQVVFGRGAPRPPRGKVFLNAKRGVVFLASNLPPTNPGRTYEMWFIPRSGKPVAAGVFKPSENGTALHVLPGALPDTPLAAIAITEEPDGGLPQPSTKPFIVAALEPAVSR